MANVGSSNPVDSNSALNALYLGPSESPVQYEQSGSNLSSQMETPSSNPLSLSADQDYWLSQYHACRVTCELMKAKVVSQSVTFQTISTQLLERIQNLNVEKEGFITEHEKIVESLRENLLPSIK